MKIGIYGGSFSPPHLGHVHLAQRFLSEMRLDRLIVIPAGNPPHKKLDDGVSGELRLEMCKVAFSKLSERVEVSDYEAYRTDPCYTVDTLRHFSCEGELFMLCGSDMFLTLDRWRDPEGIFGLCTVVCGTRTDDAETGKRLADAAASYEIRYGARTVIMDFDPIEVSSTEVREALRMGIHPVGLDEGVYEIIKRYGLYGCDEEL